MSFDDWKSREPESWEPPPDQYIWCDWCERSVQIGDELKVNHGGRFCSDECASLWAEADSAGDNPQPIRQ